VVLGGNVPSLPQMPPSLLGGSLLLGGNLMPNEEYHKGQICIVDLLLCQEGYCANCMVFAEKMQKSVFQARNQSGLNCEYDSQRLNLCLANS
jgi:hypothetical protein